MPQRLPDTLRWAAIEKWLLGYPRNSIALECQISAGAVSSIVDEWSHSVGRELANLLRDLAVTLRKLGMSPAQCALGLRIVNLIDKMGLDVNSIEAFLSEVYNRLQELDVNPKYISRYVEGLISLVDDMNLDQEEGTTAAISIQKIEAIFEKKRQHNVKLEVDFKLHKSRLEDINQQITQSDKKLEELLEKNRIIEQEIEWKSQLRDELQKYGLDVSNISRLVEGARFFSDNRYTVNEMLMTFSSHKEMLSANAGVKAELEELRNISLKVQQQNIVEDNLLQQRRLKNTELDSLKSMGFGLGELKTLHNIVVEFATENGQSTKDGEAVRNFISDIENHRHDYLRLRTKVEELKNIQSFLTTFNTAASKLGEASMTFLRKKSIAQDDIKNIIRIMELYIPGCISNADFESSLKQEGIRGQDAVKGDPISSESQLPQTHQDSDKSWAARQVEKGDVVYPKESYANFKDPASVDFAAIDSKPRHRIEEKFGQKAYSDAEPDKAKKDHASQDGLMRAFKQYKLAKAIGNSGVVHEQKDSESMDHESSESSQEFSDFMRMIRKSMGMEEEEEKDDVDVDVDEEKEK